MVSIRWYLGFLKGQLGGAGLLWGLEDLKQEASGTQGYAQRSSSRAALDVKVLVDPPTTLPWNLMVLTSWYLASSRGQPEGLGSWSLILSTWTSKEVSETRPNRSKQNPQTYVSFGSRQFFHSEGFLIRLPRRTSFLW